MLYSLIYVSSATRLFTTLELTELLRKARDRNSRSAITGMLLYKDGNFMQLLEGEESAVRALYAIIIADPRHKGAISLLQGPVATRSFADWSMGFRDLQAQTVAIEGYSDFLNTSLNSADFVRNPDRARKLLLMFKEKM